MTRTHCVTLALLCLNGAATRLHAQRVDTIRVGSPALQGARLEVGTFAIESFRRQDGIDTPTSTTTQQITRTRQGGKEVYVIQTTHWSIDGDTTVGTLVMRAADYALLHHRVKASGDSAAVTVNTGHLSGWVALPNEPPMLIDQPVVHPVFPIEGQMPWLFPLLPLREGYSAAVPHFSMWQGGEQWQTITVVGSDHIEQGGHRRDCWRVDGGELFPGYRITYWVEKRTRRILEGVARGEEPGPEYWARARTP